MNNPRADMRPRTRHPGDAESTRLRVEDMQDLLLITQQASDFLKRLAVHLEESGMPGHAGNCMIHVHKLRAALDKVDPPTQSAKGVAT